MIIRTGFLIVALVSAITIIARKRSSSNNTKDGKGSFPGRRIGKENSKLGASHVERREKEEKIENRRSESVLEQLSDEPEETDCKMDDFSVQEKKWDSVYEINYLKKIVKEKEQRREYLELELIELYCFNGKQSSVAKLQKQLKDKTAEMDMLRVTVNELRSQRKILYEEVKQNQLAEKELESAQQTILKLQAKMEVDASLFKEHFTVLEEQVSGFDIDGTFRKDNRFDKNVKAIKEVALEAMKMKRRHRELQLAKRELMVKLDAAEARIAALSCMTEQTVVARTEGEISRLKATNNYLVRQVEKLHEDRFCNLEELVYQRWLNYCLRFEFQDYHNPQPIRIQPKICKKLFFRSEDESRPSSVGPDSEILSAESDEITNTTINSSSSSRSLKSKKSRLIFNVKRWRRSNKDAMVNSPLPGKPSLFRRFSMSSLPSSSPINEGERTSFAMGKKEEKGLTSPVIPVTPRVRRVSFNDALNSVAYTCDYMPRSVQELPDSDNDQNVPEVFNNWSDRETSSFIGSIVHQEQSEMPLERAIETKLKVSTDLIKHDCHSNKINTQVELKKEIGPAECSSSGMPDVAPRTSNFCEKMVNLVVALIFMVFLFLIYISLLSRKLVG